MHRRPHREMTAFAIVSTAQLVNGCETPAGNASPGPAVIVQAPPGEPTAALDGLDARLRKATSDAAASGADIEAVVLDRNTGQMFSNGSNMPFPIASVVKLFIADDLLLQESQG